MKKITKLLLFVSVIILLTGCNSTKKTIKKEVSKGKCKITECINLIGLKDNLEKVNEIIGFEGTKKDDTYSWKLTSKEKVEVVFGDTNTIKIKLLDESIMNKKTSFKKHESIEKKIKDGEKITIDDLNKEFKTKGVLIEKTSIKQVYKWVDRDESYLEATINTVNGKCYRINGMI